MPGDRFGGVPVLAGSWGHGGDALRIGWSAAGAVVVFVGGVLALAGLRVAKLGSLPGTVVVR